MAILSYLRARLLEGSTWAGIGAALAAAGYVLPACVAGVIAAILADRGATPKAGE